MKRVESVAVDSRLMLNGYLHDLKRLSHSDAVVEWIIACNWMIPFIIFEPFIFIRWSMVNCEEIDESAKKNLHNNQKMKIFPARLSDLRVVIDDAWSLTKRTTNDN